MTLLLTRLLPPDAFGIVAVSLSITSFVRLTGNHYEVQAARLGSVDDGVELLRSATVLGAATALLTGLVLLLLPASPLTLHLSQLLPVLAVSPVLAVLVGTSTSGSGCLVAAGILAWPALRLATLGTGALIGGVTSLVALRLDSIAALIATLTLLVPLRRAHTRRAPRRRPGVLRPIRAGVLIASVGVASMALQRLDLLMVAWLRDLASAGRYEVALRLGDVGHIAFAGALSTYIASVYAVPSGPELRRHYLLATRTASHLTLPVAAGIAVWGDVAARLVFGASFATTWPVYAFLAAAVAIHALSGPNVATLMAQDDLRHLIPISALQVALNAGLNLALIPRFGLAGAAGATLATYATGNLLLVFAVRRHAGGALPLGELVLPLLGHAGASVGLALTIRALLGPTWPGLVVTGLALGAVLVLRLRRPGAGTGSV